MTQCFHSNFHAPGLLCAALPTTHLRSAVQLSSSDRPSHCVHAPSHSLCCPPGGRLWAVRRPIQAAAGAGGRAGQGPAVISTAPRCQLLRLNSTTPSMRWHAVGPPTSLYMLSSQPPLSLLYHMPQVASPACIFVLQCVRPSCSKPACAWRPAGRGRHCGTRATAASWCRQTGRQSAGRPTSL